MGEPTSYAAAFMIGLLGGAHCIGMCGGIVNALSFAIPAEQRGGMKLNVIVLAYNLGRIFSYAVAGVIIGTIGWWLQDSLGSFSIVLRIAAGLLLIAMGLYLAGWWFGLRQLEQLGGKLWVYIEPLGKKLMPVTTPSQALALGLLWGWLPCGMVYSVLTWSAAAGDGITSGLVMLSFGLGTLPVMFVSGRVAVHMKGVIQHAAIRRLAGALVILFGVWTVVGAIQYSGLHQHIPDTGHELQMHEHHH